MRIIITGGKSFKDYDKLCGVCDDILPQFKDVLIISGVLNGVDKLAERYAKEHEYAIAIFPVDSNKYGGVAGPIRNKQMIKRADGLVAFHDNYSKGTKNMILEASKAGLMVVVSYY